MTEEEKKAIKGLEWSQKQMRLENLPDYDQGHYTDIRVVLNLIKKQEKETKKYKRYFKIAINDLKGEGVYIYSSYKEMEEYYSRRKVND